MHQGILGASAEMPGEENTKKAPEVGANLRDERGGQEARRGSGVVAKASGGGEIMTRTEVALLLRCSEPHVVALIEREHLPAFRLGKLWRFRRSEVLAWCERRENGSRTA